MSSYYLLRGRLREREWKSPRTGSLFAKRGSTRKAMSGDGLGLMIMIRFIFGGSVINGGAEGGFRVGMKLFETFSDPMCVIACSIQKIISENQSCGWQEDARDIARNGGNAKREKLFVPQMTMAVSCENDTLLLASLVLTYYFKTGSF